MSKASLTRKHMTKAEYIERYGIEWYERRMEQHKLRCREYRKKPEIKKYKKDYVKEYRLNDLNSEGLRKDNIRQQSQRILFNQRHHTKFKCYEIHHCFGYNDPTKFIYIPKSLHYKIHKYLRDNNIDADTDHYKYISSMINECEEYTYISV